MFDKIGECIGHAKAMLTAKDKDRAQHHDDSCDFWALTGERYLICPDGCCIQCRQQISVRSPGVRNVGKGGSSFAIPAVVGQHETPNRRNRCQ